MKKLALLSVVVSSLLFVSCSNNDDSNPVQEIPTVSIQTGSSTKGLFVEGTLLDKVTYSNGSKEVFEYNSSSKLEKVTFYNTSNSVLYVVTLGYSVTGELNSLIKETPGFVSRRKLTLTYNTPEDITVTHEDVNIETSVVTPVFNSSIVFDGNSILSYSSFGNQTNYSFVSSNSIYSSLSSLKELAVYYRELAIERTVISDKNLDTEDAPGTSYDYYYTYEFNSADQVSKINKFATSTNSLFATSSVDYN